MESELSPVRQVQDNAPSVFIVLVNWNGVDDTLRCLSSLTNLTYPNFRTVVVDNGSTDCSSSELRAVNSHFELLQNKENLGFAGGCNVGIRYSLENGADYVWLLNNDTEVEPEALTHMVNRLKQVPNAGMCGSTLVNFDDRDTVQTLGGASYNKWLGTIRLIGANQSKALPVEAGETEARLDYVVAASLLVSRRLLEDVGLMSEEYFLYYEELDWATRAKGKYALAYAPNSIVYHREGASTGATSLSTTGKSTVGDYYSIRNRLLFARKFYPLTLLTIYLGLIGVVVNRIRRRQWRRLGMILWLALGVDQRPAQNQ